VTGRTTIAAQPHSIRNLLPLAPAALLCLVAVVQVYLTRTDHLTPWKGGGFGMFSTNDVPTRQLHVWIRGPEGEKQIELPSASLGDANLAATFPSHGRLMVLARRIASIERSEGETVSGVRIQVWRTIFSVPTFEPRLELIRESVIDLTQPPQDR